MILTKSVKQSLLVVPILGLASCAALIQQNAEPSCEGQAHYHITYESIWTDETFPIDYPSANAHYSKLVGATHNSDVALWRNGHMASQAIKDVAEKGRNFKLEKHVNWLVKIDDAGAYIDGPDLKTGHGTIDVNVDVSPEFPNITLISMIAPTPDWFVGVSSLKLCRDGEWIESYKENLYAFDGGTDSGIQYAYATKETTTQPAEVIKPALVPALGIGPDKIFGTIKFVKAQK